MRQSNPDLAIHALLKLLDLQCYLRTLRIRLPFIICYGISYLILGKLQTIYCIINLALSCVFGKQFGFICFLRIKLSIFNCLASIILSPHIKYRYPCYISQVLPLKTQSSYTKLVAPSNIMCPVRALTRAGGFIWAASTHRVNGKSQGLFRPYIASQYPNSPFGFLVILPNSLSIVILLISPSRRSYLYSVLVRQTRNL